MIEINVVWLVPIMKPFLPIPYLLRKSLVKDLAGSGLSGRNHR